MVVTPTKLTLLDPFHRSFTQTHSGGIHPRHYTKTRAPAISSQSQHRNGHLSVSAAPVWTETSAQPARKMGVASLLFHRTVSPKDALQIQSYTLDKKQQQQQLPHTQLQVHSYAREHQPRHLLSKPSAAVAHTLVQSSSQAASCETPSENKGVLSTAVLDAYQPHGLAEHKSEAKPKISKPVESQVEAEMPAVEPKCQSSSSQTQTQTTTLSKTELDASKNKWKVCFMSLFSLYSM